MTRIALTGGIASGKTFIAEELTRLSAVVIDADVLAREVVSPATAGLQAIVKRFGPRALTAQGHLDRAWLASIIFDDEAARADLNAIVHPLVRAKAEELERAAPRDRIVVHVIPLLVEAGLNSEFETIWVADLPEDVQLLRLMHRDGLTQEQAQSRIAAQASRAARLAVADVVINTAATPSQTIAQVRLAWAKLIAST